MKQKICPVCGSPHQNALLTLPEIPYFVNCLCDEERAAKQSGCGTQSLAQCCHCGFVFNRAFEAQNVIYGGGYHAERAASAYYMKHLQKIAEQINSVQSIAEAHVLEVACNTGDFLQVLSEYHPQSCVGVDPSGDESCEAYRIRRMLFDKAYLEQYPDPVDTIVSRHMIEHIASPLEMLRLFGEALQKDGILYLETPRLNWILENHVFYDFTYEHCSYYTDDFMTRLLRAAGFAVLQMNFSYDGQYFSIVARKQFEPGEIQMAESGVLRQIEADFLETEVCLHRAQKRLSVESTLAGTLSKGTLPLLKCALQTGFYLWGASGKGVMCCNLLSHSPILGCIDNNPFKQKKFIPVTGHPVLAPTSISFDTVKCILVENDVYLNEIKQQVGEIDRRIFVGSLNEILGLGPVR